MSQGRVYLCVWVPEHPSNCYDVFRDGCVFHSWLLNNPATVKTYLKDGCVFVSGLLNIREWQSVSPGWLSLFDV